MNTTNCVLIVEDTAVDRDLAIRVLRKVRPSIEIVEARDGREAVEVLERRDGRLPDLILLDINMPRMDGHEFLETWYEKSGLEVPVVMLLTSSDREADRQLADRYPGVQQHIVKPITRAAAEKLLARAA